MEERYEPLEELFNFLNQPVKEPGLARLAKDKNTGELVALKYIERGKKIDESVHRDIINHRSLRHPNIIRFKEVLLTPYHLVIILEYAGGGELFERIHTAGQFCEDEARCLFQQLISGVSYCHSMSAISHSQPKATVGSPSYIALARFCYQRSTTERFMLFGAYPFEKPEDRRNFRKTIERIIGVQYSIPDDVHISVECRNLLSRIFVADPAKRITIPEIKQDPWFLKNLPEEIIEAERKGYVETKKDQPSQTVEEIMRIMQEARVPGQGSKAGDGGQAGTGSMNVEDDEEIDVRDDYENV